MSTIDNHDADQRSQAIERLKKRSEFWSHLAAYVLINALIVTVWFAVADGGFFWPIFPMAGWGIGLFFHAMDVFRRPFTDERIRREMNRLP
jgi:predicted membrane channel-forming protein YqfA (hemolysin III family)